MSITYEEAKERTAADLRSVAGFLFAEADAIAAGDLQRMEVLVQEKLPLWFEMLTLRYAYVREQRFAAHQQQTKEL